MTREEAILYMKLYKLRLVNSIGNGLDEDIEAFDIAIKALEQEPCDKCEVGNPCLYCKYEFEPQESGAKMEVSE